MASRSRDKVSRRGAERRRDAEEEAVGRLVIIYIYTDVYLLTLHGGSEGGLSERNWDSRCVSNEGNRWENQRMLRCGEVPPMTRGTEGCTNERDDVSSPEERFWIATTDVKYDFGTNVGP